jgi:hypothetical protein
MGFDAKKWVRWRLIFAKYVPLNHTMVKGFTIWVRKYAVKPVKLARARNR